MRAISVKKKSIKRAITSCCRGTDLNRVTFIPQAVINIFLQPSV